MDVASGALNCDQIRESGCLSEKSDRGDTKYKMVGSQAGHTSQNSDGPSGGILNMVFSIR